HPATSFTPLRQNPQESPRCLPVNGFDSTVPGGKIAMVICSDLHDTQRCRAAELLLCEKFFQGTLKDIGRNAVTPGACHWIEDAAGGLVETIVGARIGGRPHDLETRELQATRCCAFQPLRSARI